VWSFDAANRRCFFRSSWPRGTWARICGGLIDAMGANVGGWTGSRVRRRLPRGIWRLLPFIAAMCDLVAVKTGQYGHQLTVATRSDDPQGIGLISVPEGF